MVGRFVYTERSLDMILRELFSAFLIAFLIALTLHNGVRSTHFAVGYCRIPTMSDLGIVKWEKFTQSSVLCLTCYKETITNNTELIMEQTPSA